MIDVVFSAIGLVLLSLFMLLTVADQADSLGRSFMPRNACLTPAHSKCLLRSMRTDAESAGPGWTVLDDLRKTAGQLMRSVNLDEVPQLINVLIGDMSLVGPRPERPVYVEQFRQIIPRYMDRHNERAGRLGAGQRPRGTHPLPSAPSMILVY
ncbi:MAG: sugar transferase [Caldilineaceae bacterium]